MEADSDIIQTGNSIRGIRRGSRKSGNYCAGKKFHQEIAWHGPIVMTTQQEVYGIGEFPPKRVPSDSKRLRAFPTTEERVTVGFYERGRGEQVP